MSIEYSRINGTVLLLSLDLPKSQMATALETNKLQHTKLAEGATPCAKTVFPNSFREPPLYAHFLSHKIFLQITLS